ncbi:3,5-dihydroxyphenylacetyl-CoA synthase DpgA [Embleya sp. NBC_00896]|uniref:3,5-dihydroxyphenylacetyl-CoA synthase DpgA n=1 Tax=Embleya sp. NBC_00896 TaxID=2975961 RepID=UPI00386E2F51|nr:type III polyketide synthase [Embleya sp. NBC_00896]
MTLSMNLPATDLLAPPASERKNIPGVSRILGVGTAVTENSYSQRELLDVFEITDPKVRSVFLNSAIERRFLSVPPRDEAGTITLETQGQLLAKHKRLALAMGARAVRNCLENAGIELSDIGYLCCVTTTGLLTPGLSALLIRDMGINPNSSRVDVVGMGCNAGLNALNAVVGWTVAHPGQVAVMVCAEACSAAYVIDATMRTSVVNSLFGDGAAAVALAADPLDAAGPPDAPRALDDMAAAAGSPRVLSFASHIITDAIDAMRYDWDDEQGKFSFFLDPEVPYVVGAHAESVIDRLLSGAGLRRSDIGHWLVHSGGKKVIDAVRVNLGLTRHDVRHTTGVLRDYGNLSSGSFLFSYERLLREEVIKSGDYGVLMTMGPGSAIETALVQW